MEDVPEGFPRQIREVRLVRVQPGDVVIAYHDQVMSQSEAEAVHDTLCSVWPMNKVLVLDGGFELAVGMGADESGPDPEGTGA